MGTQCWRREQSLYDKPPIFPKNVDNGKPFNIPSANVKNPLAVLTAQLSALEKKGVTVLNTTEIYVSTMNPGGGTSNLLFEQGNADVTAYDMYLYIEELSNNTTQLQYLQTITMRFDITTDPQDQAIQPGGPNTTFLHIDANTLVPVPVPS